jgi:hypothetical protein
VTAARQQMGQILSRFNFAPPFPYLRLEMSPDVDAPSWTGRDSSHLIFDATEARQPNHAISRAGRRCLWVAMGLS